MENHVFNLKFLFFLLKTLFFTVKYYFICKVLFSTGKPRFRRKISVFLDINHLFHCKTAFLNFFSPENLVFDVKFLFFLLKTLFFTVKYYFICKVLFSTGKPRFRLKISVFLDINHLFHCKTAFLNFFFSRKPRFRRKISVFPVKNFVFHCKILFYMQSAVFN